MDRVVGAVQDAFSAGLHRRVADKAEARQQRSRGDRRGRPPGRRGEDDDGDGADHARHLTLTLEALRVERETAIQLRDEGRINDDEVLRRLERELDLSESRITGRDNR